MKTPMTILNVCLLLAVMGSCIKTSDTSASKSQLQSFTSIKAGTEETIAAQKALFPTFHALSTWYQDFEVQNAQPASLVQSGWLSDVAASVSETAGNVADSVSDTASSITGGLQSYFSKGSVDALKGTSESDPSARQRFVTYLEKEENISYEFLDAIAKQDAEKVKTMLDQDTKEMLDVVTVLLNPEYELKTSDVFAQLIKESRGDEFIDIFAEKFLESILIKNSIKTVLEGLETERSNYLKVLHDTYASSEAGMTELKTNIENNLLDILRLKKAILGETASLVNSSGFWDNIKATFEADKINELSAWDRIKGAVCGGVSFISGWSKSLFAKDHARQTNLGGDGVSPWGKPDLQIFKE